MCDLVYLVAAATADENVLTAIVHGHGLRCAPGDDRDIGRALERERMYATFASCSCGTTLGGRPPLVSPPWTDSDVRDLIRRGWGEAKISRWKAQREVARKPVAVVDDSLTEATTMAACLGALLDAGVTLAGFVMHQAGEPVTRAAVRPRRQLTADTIHRVPADTVQLFVR